MKVAVFSESSADEAGVRSLVESVLGCTTSAVDMPPLRSRGWGTVRVALATVIRHLHYRSDADGLVVVADSNHSPLHTGDHEQASDSACRYCELRSIVAGTLGGLRAVPNRAPLLIAIGIAAPAIEGWYLCGDDPHVTEAAWANGLISSQPPYTRPELKRRTYGTDRPSIELETRRATECATRVGAQIELLERLFPGFKLLADQLRSWS